MNTKNGSMTKDFTEESEQHQQNYTAS